MQNLVNGDVPLTLDRPEPVVLIFGTSRPKQKTPSFVFLAYWDGNLNCWVSLGKDGDTWSFVPWQESNMGTYKNRIQNICSLPDNLWEGIRHYIDELGERRSYRKFHKGRLQALFSWIKLYKKDRRLRMKDLYNAELVTRILRAAGVPVLAGAPVGTITPSKLREAILDLHGLSFVKPTSKLMDSK